jgi:U2-associated protein SR140
MKQNFSNSTMGNLSRAPPPSDFAPPGSYEAGIPPGNVFHAPAEAVVQVRVPKDLQVTQLIHLMASWYHSQEDMNLALEKESQLMAAPQVQNNPLFSFLYDCTGDAGVYFRWLLWNPQGLGALSGHKRVNSTPVRIHDDVPIDWIPPTLHMPFSDVTEISEILEHLDFDSDDECDDDMPGYREEDPIPGDEDMLGPLRRARLSRMLACLPPSRAFLERRHVAPIQNFVMKHAGRGALEIVDIIQMNINRPFNASGFTIAVPPPGDSDEDDDEFMHQDLPTNGDESSHQDSSTTITAQTYNPATRTPAPPDILTDAKLVSLDIVTAVCVASYQSATPGSHRYRKLFPEAFLEAGVIVGLAETPTEYGWGMIKTDRWERRIRAVFKVWEECNCFTMDEIQSFRRIFDGVIAGRHKKVAEEKNESGDQAALAKPIFKSVEDVMAEREAAELGVTGQVDDLNSEDSEDDDHDREIDGVPIDLARLRIAKAVDGALTWQLFDSSDEKLEAIYRPIFEEQRTAVHEADEVLVDAPATDDTAAAVPPQPKVAEAKKVAEAVSSPAPKEKKDIDMFADDDSE